MFVERGFQYLKFTVVVLATYAVPAFADCKADELAKLVLRQPVSCKLIHAHFSRDKMESGEGKDGTNKLQKNFAQARIDAKTTAEKTVGSKFNTKTHSEVNSVVSPAGAAAVGTSHIELNTQLDFSMNKKREKNDELEKKTISELRNGSQSISRWSTSDWKLHITLIFKNNTPDKKFVVKKGGYVLAEIDGMQIKIPIEDDFNLTPEGESPRKLFNVPIPDETIKDTLYAYEVYYGHLEEKLKLVVDENLSYQEVDSGIIQIPTRVVNPLSVFVDFGDAKDESPVKVRSFHGDSPRRVTYGEALRAVNSELSKVVPNLFEFDEQGGLAKVLDIKFGVPDGDSIVLARIAGMIKYRLQEEDLRGWPARGGNKKELRFEKIALREIAERPRRYDGKLREICKKSIAQKRVDGEVLSFDEKYCAAMLHYNEGELKESYEYFADMTKEDYERMNADDVDKCIVLVLAIQETANVAESYKQICELIRNLAITNSDDVSFVEFAIREGNLGAYKALIKNGFKIRRETRRTDLGYAAEYGREEIAKWLLSGCPTNMRSDPNEIVKGSSPTDAGEVSKTPLFWAAKEGHFEMCKYLVEQGADVNRRFFDNDRKGEARDYDELMDQSYVSDMRIRNYINAEREIDALVPQGARDGKIVGRTVAWWREKPEVSLDSLRKWFAAGVPPSRCFYRGWDLYNLAVDAGDGDLVQQMIDQSPGLAQRTTPNGMTAAMLAIAQGNTNLASKLAGLGVDSSLMLKQSLNGADNKYNVCKFLIDNGADVNTKSDDNGFTPLLWAAKEGDNDMIARLLEKGADANAVYKANGNTALCFAIEKENLDDIRLLLQKTTKRDLAIKTDWRTVNFYQFVAMHLKDPELLEKIFSENDAHYADDDGVTPLMSAAYAGNLEAVEFLVEREDVNAHDKSFWGGNTALDYAKRQKHQDVEKCLISKMAK